MTECGGFTNLMVNLSVSNVQTPCGQRALAIPARHGVLVECFPHNVFVMLWMSYLTSEVFLCILCIYVAEMETICVCLSLPPSGYLSIYSQTAFVKTQCGRAADKLDDFGWNNQETNLDNSHARSIQAKPQ